MTSPITSFKKAWEKHKVLGIISGIFSVAGIVAITVFAAPAVASVAFAQLSMVPVLSKIAIPMTRILGKIGFSVSSAVAGAAVISSICVIGGVFKKSVNWIQHQCLPGQPPGPSAQRKKVDMFGWEDSFDSKCFDGFNKISHIGDRSRSMSSTTASEFWLPRQARHSVPQCIIFNGIFDDTTVDEDKINNTTLSSTTTSPSP